MADARENIARVMAQLSQADTVLFRNRHGSCVTQICGTMPSVAQPPAMPDGGRSAPPDITGDLREQIRTLSRQAIARSSPLEADRSTLT
jgi:hypothetical protein